MTNDDWVRDIGIAQCVIFVFQLITFGLQARRLRESVDEMKSAGAASAELVSMAQLQSKQMTEYIGEASRSANALEDVAIAIGQSAAAASESVLTSKEISAQQKLFARMQMRAYVSVNIHQGLYQDKNVRFEAKPVIRNHGNTPAHKISYWAVAEILHWPIQNDFVFSQRKESTEYTAVLNPGSTLIINAAIPMRLPDADVESIKRSSGPPHQRLCIWGTVYYEDVFGISHHTNFCHGVYWIGLDKTEQVVGDYAQKHNDSD